MANDEAVLRGFDMAVPDIGDQLHFRQPLLSFGRSSALYVARRVDWQADSQALAIVDDPEDLELATLLDDGVARHIASGEGVMVAGADFFHAASLTGVQLDGFGPLSAADRRSWIRVATPAEYVALKSDLVDESRSAFDEELGRARRQGSKLTERGNAAMLILRRCGPLHREDLAIRQLAAARQNRNLDLYRRLLARFELELGEPEDHLHEQAERHIELADALEGTYWRWRNMRESKVPHVYDASVEEMPSLFKMFVYGPTIGTPQKARDLLQGSLGKNFAATAMFDLRKSRHRDDLANRQRTVSRFVFPRFDNPVAGFRSLQRKENPTWEEICSRS